MKIISDFYRFRWFVPKINLYSSKSYKNDSVLIYIHFCISPQSVGASLPLLSLLLMFVVVIGGCYHV